MKLSACAATVKLAANERKMIAVRALAGTEPVSTLADKVEQIMTGCQIRAGQCQDVALQPPGKRPKVLSELMRPCIEGAQFGDSRRPAESARRPARLRRRAR